jgi:hypothetical protein
MRHRAGSISTFAALALMGLSCRSDCAAFQLDLYLNNPGGQFTPHQAQLLNAAIDQAERLWNTVITGYRPGISIGTVSISVSPTNVGLAQASFAGTTSQGGFVLATSGFIQVNTAEVENFANWQGHGANGLNFLDELLVHEAGHALGVGSLWTHNNVYAPGSFRYTGQHGLAAYKAEFDAAATFVPVENAGEAGTQGSHWDQRMRSSVQEGNPNNYWPLDPRVGVVDPYGRDRALEVMTGGIDPDYGEPFLSRLTVESMRDLGYTVAAFEDFNGDGVVSGADFGVWAANFGAVGRQVDGLAFGDADRDRAVAGRDFLLWQRAFAGGAPAAAVPEPAGVIAGLLGVVGSLVFCRGIGGMSGRERRG